MCFYDSVYNLSRTGTIFVAWLHRSGAATITHPNMIIVYKANLWQASINDVVPFS